MHKFGLVGKNISYSFSKNFFTQKFSELNLDDYEYQNFDINSISDFPKILASNVKGLNITIPYKEQVIPFLNEIDEVAKEIGAVNTIKFIGKNQIKGFNTDVYGFEKSLNSVINKTHTKALVLGTGGASKAIIYVLKKLAIDFLIVSRNPLENQIPYNEITEKEIIDHSIIINCTPLGTFPNVDEFPNIPYKYLTEKHLLYDLIYNPAKTKFLLEGEKKGATICNGSKMLEYQAEKSWEIWNL